MMFFLFPRWIFLFALLATDVESAALQTETATNCTNYGALRLVGNNDNATAGTVEICLDSKTLGRRVWGRICRAFFADAASQVACRQLGYYPPGTIKTAWIYHRRTNPFELGSGPIFLGYINCTGSEDRIVDCDLRFIESTCGPTSVVSLECTMPCTVGDVRLTGDRPGRGTVWVCINGAWSTVCDNFWNIPDARVVCRQLSDSKGVKYNSSDAKAYTRARFGEGFGPILLDKVKCQGNEKMLSDCFYNMSNCDHSSDAGVDCIGEPAVSTTLFTAYTSPIQLLTTTLLTSLFTTVTSVFFTPSSNNLFTSLTQSLSPSPTQATSTNSTKILLGSSLISSNRTQSLSKIFVTSTKLSNFTTTMLNNFTTSFKQSATSSFEFTSFLSPSLSQSTLTHMHNYASSLMTKFSSQSTSKLTSLSMHSLTKSFTQSTKVATSTQVLFSTEFFTSTPMPLTPTATAQMTTSTKSFTRLKSTIKVTSTPKLLILSTTIATSLKLFSSTKSLTHSSTVFFSSILSFDSMSGSSSQLGVSSTTIIVTPSSTKSLTYSSTASFTSTHAMSSSLSHFGASTTVANSLTTTDTHLTLSKSIFSTKESVEETTIRSATLYTSLSSYKTTQAMKSISTQALSYALLSPSPFLPSSIPSSGQLSLSVTASIFGVAGFIGFIICIFFIIIGVYLCRKYRRRRAGQTVYDLTSEVTPITAKRYGADTCIHIDTQSQDGDSVNSMVYEDVCPTTETEQLELKPVVMETEPARQSGYQETSHSSGTATKRKELPTPKSDSDTGQELCSGAGLQELGGNTELSAEEMEMRKLPLSSSDEDIPLYLRSSETATCVHSGGTEEDNRTQDLDSEREHKPTFGYQQL